MPAKEYRHMIVVFEDEYLKTMYLDGKCDKKHRFQPEIVRGYQRCISRMVDASSIEALARIGSLHYEILQGDKAGISSVRVNLQYRIEFKVEVNNEDTKLTICSILELSNHYK